MKAFVRCAGSAKLVLILLAALLSGCGLSNLAEPTITNRTFPWVGQTPRVFTAAATVPSGWVVQSSYVRFTRHLWPAAVAAAHQVVAMETSPGSGIFNATSPDAQTFPTSHKVFYEWFLDYRLAAGGSEILTARSGRQELVVGCTRAQTQADLNGAAAVLRGRFNTPQPHLTLPLLGYGILPHFSVSVAGAGVTFAGVMPALSLTTADLMNPSLVFYRPRPPDAGETAGQHFAAIREPLIPDPPYTLIGGGYSTLYNPAVRPILGCIPSDEWFVHEAGFHLPDGNMQLTQPNDNGVLGSANMTAPPAVIPPGVWHPRLWDLHLWLSLDGNTAPELRINRPGGVPGLPPPLGAFFRPETFE